LQRSANFRPPINVVAEKNDLAAIWMAEVPTTLVIAELDEQGFQFVGVAVDVAYDVIGLIWMVGVFHNKEYAGGLKSST
jgi:hypothetical protein